MPKTNRSRDDLPSRTVGQIAETFLLNRLLTYKFEVYSPIVDAGTDFLAFNPSGEPLRIQSKGRSERMGYLWDITIGQRTIVGPPTHYFFMHGSPPGEVHWLVPAHLVHKVWKKTPKGTMRVRMNKPESDHIRVLFQPFIGESGIRKAAAWRQDNAGPPPKRIAWRR